MAIKKHNTTVSRLVFSLLSVFLLPIIILYILYTFRIVGTVRTELERSVIADTKYSIQQIDNKIDTLNNAVEMFQRGNGYQSYLTRSFDNDAFGTSAISTISSDITYIYLLSEIADDFVIALPDYDTMFSASGMQTSEHYLSDNFITTQYSKERLRDLFFNTNKKNTIYIENLATKRADGEHLVFFYPLQKTIRGKGANAAFSVPLKRISSILEMQSQVYDIQTIVLDEGGNFLFSHNMTEQAVQNFLTMDEGKKEVKINGFLFRVFENTSKVNGWSYYTFLPKDNSLVNQTLNINRYFMIYMTVVLLVGISLILLFFKINYSPIKALRTKTLSIVGNLNSNEDEIKTIDYALTELHNNAQKSIDEIKQIRLQKLLNDYYSSLDEFNKDCEQVSLSFSYDFFEVSIFQFKNNIEDKEIAELLKKIFSEDSDCEILKINKNRQIVVIHNLKTNNTIDIRQFYTALGTLNDLFGLNPIVGIGRTHEGTGTIEKSYLQANSALEFAASESDRKIIHYNEVLDFYSSEKWTYPQNEIRSFVSALEALDSQKTEESIDALLQVIKNRSTSILMAKAICYDILKTIAANPYLTKEGSFKITEIISQIINETKRTEMIELILFIKNNYKSLFSYDSSSDIPKLIDEIIDYINDNYCRYDFSIQELCDKFKIGPATASQFFKENTNRGLLEYVIDRRMDKAKEMLISTNKAVKEISYEVGYYNVTSFIRRFKDHEGVTPNEYRFRK